MKTNYQVVKAWAAGKEAGARNLRTDGKTLWSYRLPIGVTVDGAKVVFPFLAPLNISQTTSKHVSYALQVCDRVTPPELVEELREAWLAYGPFGHRHSSTELRDIAVGLVKGGEMV